MVSQFGTAPPHDTASPGRLGSENVKPLGKSMIEEEDSNGGPDPRAIMPWLNSLDSLNSNVWTPKEFPFFSSSGRRELSVVDEEYIKSQDEVPCHHSRDWTDEIQSPNTPGLGLLADPPATKEIFQRSDAPSPPSIKGERRVQSPSSSYPSEGKNISRIQSPLSTSSVLQTNKLDLADLAGFIEGLGAPPNLSTDSPVSPPQSDDHGSGHDAAGDEAAAAITQWLDESPAQESRPEPEHALATSKKQVRLSLGDARGDQFDGGMESTRLQSPIFSAPPTNKTSKRISSEGDQRPAKRKASIFSLHSISSTLAAKRPRLSENIRRFASSAQREGAAKFKQARHFLKQLSQADKAHDKAKKAEFEAWRANRRRARPSDPLKGKWEKGHGLFSVERSMYGTEEWWQEGVAQYQAPSWMFGSDAAKRR